VVLPQWGSDGGGLLLLLLLLLLSLLLLLPLLPLQVLLVLRWCCVGGAALWCRLCRHCGSGCGVACVRFVAG
jgi:hypothetical protein